MTIPGTLCCVLAAALPSHLRLEEALAAAKERQPALRAQRAQVQAAQARSRETLAPMLPTVSMNLGYSRSTSNFVARPSSVPSSLDSTASVSLASFDFWSGALTAQATLWDFGERWNRYRASLASADAAEAQLRAQEVSAALAVRTAFFTALAQKELLEVAKATLANTEAHARKVEGLVSVGSRPEIDLAQSRVDRANAKLGVLNASNAYAVSRARLGATIGFEGPASFDVLGDGGGPLPGEDAPVEQLHEEALRGRPEAAGLAAQVVAQEHLVKSTRATFYPSLGLSLSATLAARQLTQPVPNLSGQLSLTWPLYQGGLTGAQLREGEAALAHLGALQDGLVLEVKLAVDQAQLAVRAAREAVEVAGEALTAAKERLRLAEGRYQVGSGSALELGDAQVSFTTAAAQRVQAIYSLATARAQLHAALGRP